MLRVDPIVLLRVTGDEIAPTASDQRVACEDRLECDDLGHTIAAPSRDLVAGWRKELVAGGMPDVALIGLAPVDEDAEDGFDPEDAMDFIGGTRGSDAWHETGVITAPGWVLLEDKEQSL